VEDIKIKEKHKLRKPSGPYVVGVRSFVFEYTPEGNSDKKRFIPCLCFYPAMDVGEGKLKKYINDKILPGAGSIETNSYIGAHICDGKHPLLLYSHGFSLGLEANTVQFEELASHGYLVLSIGHLGDGSYELPNGEVVMFDMEKMMKEYHKEAIAGTELFAKYADWLRGDGRHANMEQHRDYYKKIIDKQPKMVAQSEIWVKDSLVALDMFLNEAEQEGSMFFDCVDKKNIGAFGMSFGGSVALDLALECDSIKASANLDGFFYSSNWERAIKKPVLLMQHDGIGGLFLAYPFLKAENDAYLMTVGNSTHGNFMDYNEILAGNIVSKAVIGDKEVELGMLGEIDPDKMESIMNVLLLDFFNKYLKGMGSRVIDTYALPADVILLKH